MNENHETYEELYERAKATVALRRGKAFRRKLFFARVKEQLFGGAEERRDLMRFLAFKLGDRTKDCRPLSDFDPTAGVEKDTAEKLISLYEAAPHARRAVVFSMLHFNSSGGGQRGAQIAKTLKKRGFDVLYVYLGDNFYTFDTDFIEGLDLHLPLKYFEPEALADIAGDDAVAFFEHPAGEFLPFLRALKKRGAATVYELIDNWDSGLGAGWYKREDHLAFLKEADILVGTARNLCAMAEKDSGRRVLYNANAVDADLFDPNKQYEIPSDMPVGKKTMIYYGHLEGEWLDWELMYDTARRLPDCAFVVIGKGSPSCRTTPPQNVHFIGPRMQRELPAYLAAADIALLHFKTDNIGSYVSPLKVFEYLAMRKLVLAAPLPDIAGYPNVVCASDAEEWARTIKKPPELVPCDDFIAANSWSARCGEILAEVGK